MALSIEERKARRTEGVERAKQEMTVVQKIHRSLINGRPPASELKTPTAAVTAARILYRELESRLTVEGFSPNADRSSGPKPGDCAVSVAYITADLSVLGFTGLFVPGEEARLMGLLDGNIMLGLIFGVVDEDKSIIMGTRPFLATKQTDGWLDELTAPVRFEIEHP